jgi:uncharacterized protein
VPTYRTPGVYFEWLDTPPAIGERRTDIAGLVGVAARGPLHRPVPVESWTQFQSVFGGHIEGGYLAYAVEGFFANGGSTCWVVRAADPRAARPARAELLRDHNGQPTFRLTASSPGTWGRQLGVTVVRTAQRRFSLWLQLPDGTSELWRDLTTDEADPRNAVRILNDPDAGSQLVDAEWLRPPPLDVNGATLRLEGGDDGLRTLAPGHLSGMGAPPGRPWGLATLEAVDQVSIVAIPDAMPKPAASRRHKPRPPRCQTITDPPGPPPPAPPPAELPPAFDDDAVLELQTAQLAHCRRLMDRVAVLDPRPTDRTPQAVLDWRRRFDATSAGEWAALYYPWLRVPDPLGPQGALRAVPPSGHVAGIYARTDRRSGVHKPPANERLEGSGDVVVATDDLAHGELNEQGVNVIRAWNGRGLRVAGARTLSAAVEWRYVNVRRLLSMIEEAIDEDTQWAVFEPNTADLRGEVDRIARSFLDRLWRQGMLDGATPEDAYFVRCDETTNTQEDADLGRLVCMIGVQPPWPAEFVIARIGRTAQATDIVESAGVPRG